MKGFKYVFTLFALFFVASISMAQSESQVSNELSIEVFDMITREPLRDYDFWFVNEQDTLKMHIDSVDNMKIDLDEPNHYSVTVFKDGYDAVSVDLIDSIGDSSIVHLHVFVPKVKLTKEEKRLANYHSKNLPPSIFDKSPCFNKVDLKRKYMLTMKMLVDNKAFMISTVDFVKLSDY